MPLIALALIASASAKPLDLTAYKTVSVDYTMTTKGTVSCTTVFKGTGGDPVVDGDRVTFSGTWEIVSDSCDGNTVWGGLSDRAAFHTLKLAKGGKAIDAWVVHAAASDHEPFKTEIKARNQFWINELEAVPVDGAFTYTTSEVQGVFPLSVTIDHMLAVALGSEDQKQPKDGDAADKDQPSDKDAER